LDTNIRGQINSDDDEWLDHPTLEWTLQDVLKAEKIIDMLLRVAAWSRSTATITWVPLLADVASEISFSILEQTRDSIAGAVEIVRVKTVTDPSGRSSFHFRLSESRYPVLRLLRSKEADMAARVVKDPKGQDDLTALREEMIEKEESIHMALCKSIADHRLAIDKALTIVARLDVLMAKAAFAEIHGGVVPRVVAEGKMDVKEFVHPLVEGHEVVPISLRLGTGRESPNRALVISGANGGGKTLAMKSFGLVAQMVKLGLPIPIRTDERPVVGFFDRIITALGDRQSVTSGQSTFMAQLSIFAETLESLEKKRSDQTLVLLDELGSGTESDGGGAIGQAVLEHMLETPACRIVATTHSSRLKALSFDEDRFACATVMLEASTGLRLPSYRLEVRR
jgi:DNA mismatch repair protein MutS2